MIANTGDESESKKANEDATRLAIKKPVKPKRPPEEMPWVIPVNCEGCADCVNRCPQGILVMTETNVPDVFVPWLYQSEFCTGCGKCSTGCVMGAIVMTSYVEMAKERFRGQKPTIKTD